MLVMIKSLQKGVRVKKGHDPKFDVLFGVEPVEVSVVVADYLVDNFNGMFVKVQEKKSKKGGKV